jgi:predicted transcriptional regulator of viral defense system
VFNHLKFSKITEPLGSLFIGSLTTNNLPWSLFQGPDLRFLALNKSVSFNPTAEFEGCTEFDTHMILSQFVYPMRKLPKELKKGPFTYRQAASSGLNQRQFRQLVTEGAIVQVARGVYIPSGLDYSEEDQFRVATLIVGEPSAICMISALSYYGLTDLVPGKTWIMVPNTKRSQSTELKLQRTRNPEWRVGIEKHDGFSVTSIERTIVEVLCARSKLGAQVGVHALRRAIQGKKATLSNVMAIAKRLGVLHRVLPYIEALS